MTKYYDKAKGIVNSISCTCGWCNNKIGLDILRQVCHSGKVNKGSLIQPIIVDSEIVDFYYGLCPVCTKPLIYDSETKGTYPPNSEFSVLEFLPNDILLLFEEIRKSFSIAAYSACLLLCRKIIMHIAVDLGADENNNFLYYIDFFEKENYINKKSKNWIDKIRTYGNDQNHKIIIGNKEDAENIILFTEMLMKIIYDFPNRQK